MHDPLVKFTFPVPSPGAGDLRLLPPTPRLIRLIETPRAALLLVPKHKGKLKPRVENAAPGGWGRGKADQKENLR